MTTAERLELIRAKLGTKALPLPKAAGMAAAKAGTVRTRPKRIKYTRKGYFSHESFPPSETPGLRLSFTALLGTSPRKARLSKTRYGGSPTPLPAFLNSYR